MFKKFAIAAVMATAATASFADVDTTADLDTLASQVMLADTYIDANNGKCSGHGGAGSDSLAAAIEFRAVGDNAWYPGAPSICSDKNTALSEIAYRAQQTMLDVIRGGLVNHPDVGGMSALLDDYQLSTSDQDVPMMVEFIKYYTPLLD